MLVHRSPIRLPPSLSLTLFVAHLLACFPAGAAFNKKSKSGHSRGGRRTSTAKKRKKDKTTEVLSHQFLRLIAHFHTAIIWLSYFF